LKKELIGPFPAKGKAFFYPLSGEMNILRTKQAKTPIEAPADKGKT
jgi:hypothetical protein